MKISDTLKEKVILLLDVLGTGDSNVLEQVEQHIASAYDYLTERKGIDKKLMESDSGVWLLKLVVGDMWSNGGKFEFSPATNCIFDSLVDASILMRYREQ